MEFYPENLKHYGHKEVRYTQSTVEPVWEYSALATKITEELGVVVVPGITNVGFMEEFDELQTRVYYFERVKK